MPNHLHGGEIVRLAVFTETPTGGNPAGVWIGDELPPPHEMQRIAAEVGYSETAFVAPRSGTVRTIRYFSPKAEVSFCGHATIATGIAVTRGHGAGEFVLHTSVGDVPIATTDVGGRVECSLTSVEPKFELADESLVADALVALRWKRSELDESIPPVRAYAGAWHFILATATRERLARLDYDFNALGELMLTDGLTTLQLVHREPGSLVFHSRNPFPIAGVVEDPATGSAAAALGGYLRDSGLLKAPASLDIRQGDDMGRPSRLMVSVPRRGGITVTGTAVDMT